MATKIDIISGFLGAGKTTFIKKLVKDLYMDTNVVILENEFGKVNIDEGTFQRESIQVKSIYAGCICCSSSMYLAKGISEIMSEFQPDRIIIEPTGIAKLSDVKKLVMDEISDLALPDSGDELKSSNNSFELDKVITIVDAKNYHVRALVSKDFFEDQIRASEIIFLSKTDLIDDEGLGHVKSEINRIQPACQVVDEVWDQISTDRLNEFMEYKPDSSKIEHKLAMRRNHKNDFDSYELVTEQSLSTEQITSFVEEIAKGSYGEIHRVKGVCHDEQKGMYSVDYVPKELIIKPVNSGEMSSQTSKLCLIGRQLKRVELNQFLLQFK
jgi:G3E family GTPase